jgi:phosphoglycolate phosphatase-like HAD superfamily hydrolase
MSPLAVLFDFDGTLVQTREASWKIFARVNESFKLGVATQQEYFRLLEDNLFQGIRRLCRDDAQSQQVVRHFLAELEAHYQPNFVPGIVDVVRTLAANCSLAVVSSNSTATIRRLLAGANVAHCFSHVFGGEVEPDKRAVVRRFLADQSYLIGRDCSPAYREGDQPGRASAKDLVLVTDTTGDGSTRENAASVSSAWPGECIPKRTFRPRAPNSSPSGRRNSLLLAAQVNGPLAAFLWVQHATSAPRRENPAGATTPVSPKLGPFDARDA